VTFEAALRRSWATVITPAYCRGLFGRIRAQYARVVTCDGLEVRGWGRA
jgi:hypothetical protein